VRNMPNQIESASMIDPVSNPGSKRHAASFSPRNKLYRVVWQVSWLLLARFSPPPLHAWRRIVLIAFGAQIGSGTRIYSSVRIWNPRNLTIGNDTLIGPRVNCYNQGRITIGDRVVISQDVSLCASTHDVIDPAFPLQLRPIKVGTDAWIAAEAFVGPGVEIGEGAVLGARAVAMRPLGEWTYFTGNPAIALKSRPRAIVPS
jgi:putative colanic acid biosynthesis acetyltransferase WcaF